MEKKITKEPLIGPECEIINSNFLPYTELGAHNYPRECNHGRLLLHGTFLHPPKHGRREVCQYCCRNVRIGPTNHPMERPTLHHITYRRRMFGVSDTDDTEFLDYRNPGSRRSAMIPGSVMARSL